MKVDFQQSHTQVGCCSTASTSVSKTTTTPSSPLSSSLLCTDEKTDETITIVPFERHRQDEVAALFQNGLLSYDFNGNDAWKLVNEWFVAERLNKEMKDVYTGFHMASSKQQQQQAEAACGTTPASSSDAAVEARQNHENDHGLSSFEGLHFMTAIDFATNKVVGCVGIKRPDQHTLAVLQQSAEQFSNKEHEGSSADVATTRSISMREETATCELVRLSVDKTCRRQGLGKRLVQAVEHFSQLHGYRRICLTTLQVQTQAVALYQSCGYSVVHEEVLDYNSIIPNLPQEYQQSGRNKIISLVYLCKQLDNV